MAKRHLYIQGDSTNDCNLKCSHCYHNNEGNVDHIQDDNLMSLNEVKSMIDDLAETAKRWEMIPRIAISGGDPLMREDHLEILEYACKKKVITNLLTNGTLITPKKARELLEQKVEAIQVSLDGSKRTHNKIRRKDFAYDMAIEGIRNASKEGLNVTVAMTLMQSNKKEFEDVIQNAILAGAKKVGFKTYNPDSNLGIKDPEFINAKEIYEMVKETERLNEKYRDKINVLQSDVLWQILEKENEVIKTAKEQNKYLWGCSAGFRMLSILSDGTVYPCRRLPIKIGRISDGIGNLILEKKVMQNLRDLNKMRENTLCDKVVHCRGCRAIAYAVTGDYMAKDPMCFKEYVQGSSQD